MDQHPDLSTQPIVLFDGVCHLCQFSVNFIIQRDRQAYFRFAPLQSDLGQRMLSAYFPKSSPPDSIVLCDAGGVYLRSTAAIRIARRLSFPWSCLGIFVIIPAVIRDPVYDWLARRRYRWFGRDDVCRLPAGDWPSRFLE